MESLGCLFPGRPGILNQLLLTDLRLNINMNLSLHLKTQSYPETIQSRMYHLSSSENLLD